MYMRMFCHTNCISFGLSLDECYWCELSDHFCDKKLYHIHCILVLKMFDAWIWYALANVVSCWRFYNKHCILDFRSLYHEHWTIAIWFFRIDLDVNVLAQNSHSKISCFLSCTWDTCNLINFLVPNIFSQISHCHFLSWFEILCNSKYLESPKLLLQSSHLKKFPGVLWSEAMWFFKVVSLVNVLLQMSHEKTDILIFTAIFPKLIEVLIVLPDFSST